MKPSTRLLIDKIAIVGGIGLMILALVGEIIGWWNDMGLLLTVIGAAAGLFGLFDINGYRLLTRFEVQENRMAEMLGMQDQMLGMQDQMLGKQDATIQVLERIEQVLDERLPRA